MQQESNKLQSDVFETTVARNLGEVEAIRPIWEEMQSNQSYPIVNADIDRFLSVLESRRAEGVRPHVVLLKRGGHPEAMVIARVEKRQLPCRIGYKTLFKPSLQCLSVVYGGFLGNLNETTSALLVRELKRALRHGVADVVLLSLLNLDSQLYRLVRSESGLLCKDRFSMPQLNWQTQIPDTAEAFYKSLSAHRRRYVKYYCRKLEEACSGQVELKCYQAEKDLDYVIDTAAQISVSTYKNALEVGFVDDSMKRSLLRQAARDGWLRAYVLYANHKPCAFEYGVKYGTTFFAEHMGYDPKLKAVSPGTILWVKVIEVLSEDPDVHLLDCGFGDAVYKERFGTDSQLQVHTFIYARRLKPIFVNTALFLCAVISLLVKSVVARAGLTLRLKRYWRERLRKKQSRK